MNGYGSMLMYPAAIPIKKAHSRVLLPHIFVLPPVSDERDRLKAASLLSVKIGPPALFVTNILFTIRLA